MGFLKRVALMLILSAFPFGAFAQNDAPPSENGAILAYLDSGWSFGLPAVRAVVSVPGVGTALSPEKKTLVAPGFGIGVKVKFLVPYFGLAIYDTGKATAAVGSFRSEVEATTLTYTGGVRLVGGKSRIRGYVNFGGGALYQDLKGTFYVGGSATPAGGSVSLGLFSYGAGLQVFAGKKWGSDIGFDGFRLGQALNGAGQNFSRVRIGIFYQSKSAIQ